MRRAAGLLADYGALLILASLSLYFAAATPGHVFLSTRNLVNVAHQVSANLLLAIGLTFVILTGGIDLSVGSLLALGAVLSADCALRLADSGSAGICAAVLLAAGVGGLLGGWNGLLITRLRAAPFIATLAMLAIARGAALKYTEARPISGLPDRFNALGGGAAGELLGIPPAVWVAGLLLLAAHVVVVRTAFGRLVCALGSNEEAARLAGVDTRNVKLAVYAISGALAGLAGVFLAARVNSGDPLLGVGAELNAITAVVLGGTALSGGRGSMLGTLLGALVMGVLDNGLALQGVQEFDKQMLGGGALLLAIVMDRLKARYLLAQR